MITLYGKDAEELLQQISPKPSDETIQQLIDKLEKKFVESDNPRSLEERKEHLKKCIETVSKIKPLSRQDMKESMEFRRKAREQD